MSGALPVTAGNVLQEFGKTRNIHLYVFILRTKRVAAYFVFGNWLKELCWSGCIVDVSAFFHLNDGELPNLRGYRSLLSQNRHEGYLTFGKARRDYVDYLKHGTLSSEAFLCVQQYGPWNLTKGEQLGHFCRAATAFTLAGSDAVKK